MHNKQERNGGMNEDDRDDGARMCWWPGAYVYCVVPPTVIDLQNTYQVQSNYICIVAIYYTDHGDMPSVHCEVHTHNASLPKEKQIWWQIIIFFSLAIFFSSAI